MKITVFFKNGTVRDFEDVANYGIKGKCDNILRIDIKDGRVHFINFSEVSACIEDKEETDEESVIEWESEEESEE